MLMGSSRVVRFTCVRPGGRLIYPGLLGSLARSWGRWVFPWSLCSPGCALGVVRIIRGRWVHPVLLGTLARDR